MSSTPHESELPPFQFSVDANSLEMAVANKKLYDAFVEAGFTEAQAMLLVCSMLKAHMSTTVMVERGVFTPPDGEV